MTHSQWHNFGIVVKRALKMPFSIILISVSALFALIMHDLLGLFVLCGSMAAVAAYSLVKLQDEQFIRMAIREDADRRRAQDTIARTFRIEELDVESRVRMKTIVKLQNEIAEDVADSPIDENAAGLADTVAQTESLVDRALAMAQQNRELQRFLAKTDAGAIEARIHSIQTRLESETDPARQSEIQIALKAKRQELEDYRAIEQAGVRIMDQLESIECSFASLRARLVLVKSTDIKDWMSANEELRVELGGLNSSVDTLEQTINDVLLIGRQGT
ncbi:MAG: hypothetical protein ABFD49_10335 [Armatimonadota bacterium]|nr:hypothetical protein [bacterium]